MWNPFKSQIVYVDKPVSLEVPKMLSYSIAGVFLTNLLILSVMILSISSGQDLNKAVIPQMFTQLDRIESKLDK